MFLKNMFKNKKEKKPSGRFLTMFQSPDFMQAYIFCDYVDLQKKTRLVQ